MRTVLTWWDLDEADGDSPRGTTLAALRRDLDGGVAEWQDVPGLRAKYWLGDDAANRWGAVMVWTNDDAPSRSLPPNRAAAIIGRAPTARLEFRLETAVSGSATTEEEDNR